MHDEHDQNRKKESSQLGNKVGSDGAVALSEMLTVNTTLNDLYLYSGLLTIQ